MNHIFYLMGKSASGKDSLYKELASNEELGFKPIVLYTTRPIRENEIDGETYKFVTKEFFNEVKDSSKLIESRTYNVVGDVWTYFTLDDGSVDLTKNNYIVIGTLESYAQMRKYYGSEVLIPIYIEVDNGTRLKRAIKREDKEDTPRYAEVCRRFLADESDFSEENLKLNEIEQRFENTNFDNCYHQILKYIKKILK